METNTIKYKNTIKEYSIVYWKLH